jgi:hypothetical protein
MPEGRWRAESPSAVETEDRIRLASGNRFALNLAQSSLAYFLLLLNQKLGNLTQLTFLAIIDKKRSYVLLTVCFCYIDSKYIYDHFS